MRGLTDFVDHFLGQIVRWKNHGCVSTVHPGEFDVLEHPPTTVVSPSEMQSTSNSIASSKNLSRSTGLPGATAKAS